MRLKELKKTLSLTTDKFAELLEMPSRTLAAYERDESVPSVDFALRLYTKINLNIHWFLTGHGQMFRNVCENTKFLTKNKKNIDLFTFGKRLIQLQAENNMMSSEFAKLLDISESKLERYCLGKAEPTVEFLNTVKSNFDVSIDWLLYDEVAVSVRTSDFGLNAPELAMLKQLLNKISI